MASMDLEQLLLKYAVKNALEFGEANKNAVIGKVFAENPELKQQAQDVVQTADQIIEQVNQLSEDELEEKKSGFEYVEEQQDDGELPDLPGNPEDGVVMRMAPFPSGMLHIGNARMAVLNDEYVKRYGGTLYLVIDDTAGSEEKKPLKEAYHQIPEDLEWLGIDFDEVVYKSDRMDRFYEYGEKFLQHDWAYVCTCDAETLRENRRNGVACEHRDHTPEQNLEMWQDMLDGDYRQGEAVVRLKTDIQHDDPAFRDRVLLRVSELDHPRVGSDYHVWPMLEFSWAIDDHYLGMTHIIRGQDLIMEDKMEQFMWDLLGWEHPHIVHHGLLNIQGITISTSQSKRKIDSGEYSGWHDPRTWSLMSLQRRGFKPEAIRNFVLSFGMSNSNVQVPIDSLYTENRKIIDAEADRYFFVEEPKKLEITGVEGEYTAEADLHPEYPERGHREIPVSASDGSVVVVIEEGDCEPGTELRLKDLFNVRINADGSAERINNDLDYALDNNLSIVQWLPVDDCLDCHILMPDGSHLDGLCESNIVDAEDQVVQFIRFGFCRIDDVTEHGVSCFFTHR